MRRPIFAADAQFDLQDIRTYVNQSDRGNLPVLAGFAIVAVPFS